MANPYVGLDGLSREDAKSLAESMNNFITDKKYMYTRHIIHSVLPGWYVCVFFDSHKEQHMDDLRKIIANHPQCQETYIFSISCMDHRHARACYLYIPQYRGSNDYRPGERY